MRLIPSELFLLHQQFVVEESLSVIRHDLRNKLGAIRNASFYVRRKLDKTAPEVAAKDPRIPEFLGMITTELDAAEILVQSRLPATAQAEPMAASAILERTRELVPLPANVKLTVEHATDPRVRISPEEAALAMFCLVQNAVDALDERGGAIRIGIGADDGHIALEVDDDGPGFAAGAQERVLEPFFTTRAGRMGVGLNIARRIMQRWSGKIAIAPLERGVRAALLLKAEP
jgi:signal transduction histidine kinase